MCVPTDNIFVEARSQCWMSFFFHCSPPNLLKQGLSGRLELVDLSRLTYQRVIGIHLPLPLQDWNYRHTSGLTWLFTWLLGMQTQASHAYIASTLWSEPSLHLWPVKNQTKVEGERESSQKCPLEMAVSGEWPSLWAQPESMLGSRVNSQGEADRRTSVCNQEFADYVCFCLPHTFFILKMVENSATALLNCVFQMLYTASFWSTPVQPSREEKVFPT